MEQFRRSPIMEFGDMKVIKIIDYLLDETGNPKSNVLKYYLDDGSWYAVRPSGTEPKIKLYIYSKDKSSEISKRKTEIIEGNVINVMNSIE